MRTNSTGVISPTQLRQSASDSALPRIALPSLVQQRSPVDHAIFSRNWAPEHRRLLHERRERHWLRGRNKHSYIDFSDSERAELKRYFDALAERSKKMGVNKLEDMLVSLGLAATREDVDRIIKALDGGSAGMEELDFDQYLEIIRKRTHSDIFPIFKATMEGKLGDRNLDFQTIISTYKRQLILDSMTSKVKKDPLDGQVLTFQEFQTKYKNKFNTNEIKNKWDQCPQDEPQKKGSEILQNFAALHRSRYEDVENAGGQHAENAMSFEASGTAPLGGLEMCWRGVVTEHGLASSRPNSAEVRKQRTLDPPLSPRVVVNNILKVKLQKNRTGRGTIMVCESSVAKANRGFAVSTAI